MNHVHGADLDGMAEALAETRELEERWVRLVRLESGQNGVVARVDLAAGEVVTRFLGPDLAWEQVPEAEAVYVNSFEPFRWTVPRTLARFVNHSCQPNCVIRADRALQTVRPIGASQQLGIDYEWADAACFEKHPEHYFWDPRWSFECRCGQPSCRGRVERYRPK